MSDHGTPNTGDERDREVEAVARVLLDADLWLRMRMDEMPLPPDAAHDIALDVLAAIASSRGSDG